MRILLLFVLACSGRGARTLGAECTATTQCSAGLVCLDQSCRRFDEAGGTLAVVVQAQGVTGEVDVLEAMSGEQLVVRSNGLTTFDNVLRPGAAYAFELASVPPALGCSITPDSGIADGPVSVTLHCEHATTLRVFGLQNGHVEAVYAGQTIVASADGTYPFTGRGTGAVEVTAPDDATQKCNVLRLPHAVDVTCVQAATVGAWNTYALRSDPTLPCADGGPYFKCVHLGERRSFAVPDGCDGVTAADALGVFDWQCIAGAVFSTQVKPGKGLVDLIDMSALAFRANQVIIFTPRGELRSPESVWHTNAIVEATTQELPATVGAIFVVRADVTLNFHLNADGQAFVVARGQQVTGTMNVNDRRHVWVEGDFRAPTSVNGVRANLARRSVFNRLTLSSFDTPFYGNEPESLLVRDFTAVGCQGYLVLTNSRNNTLVRGVIHRGYLGSIYDAASTNNVYVNVTLGHSSASSSGAQAAMRVSDAAGMVVVNAVVHNSAQDGVEVANASDTSLLNVSSINNAGFGMELQALTGGVRLNAHNLLVLNNGGIGAYVTGSWADSLLDDFIVAFNGAEGVLIYSETAVAAAIGGSGVRMSSDNAGSPANATLQCQLSVNTTSVECPGATVAAGSVPAVILSPPSGTAGVPRPFGAGLGLGDPLPSAGARGVCATAECAVWSFVPTIPNVRSLPDGLRAFTHRFARAGSASCADYPGTVDAHGGCESRALVGAVEDLGDGVGNDNALCESNETCTFSPRIGAVQPAGPITASAVYSVDDVVNVRILTRGN